jgi:hypothetical protein
LERNLGIGNSPDERRLDFAALINPEDIRGLLFLKGKIKIWDSMP